MWRALNPKAALLSNLTDINVKRGMLLRKSKAGANVDDVQRRDEENSR